MGDNNDDNDLTPAVRFDVIVKNRDNVENASTARDNNFPIIALDREKDGDSTTGDADGVSHAKGTKCASNLGSGLAAKEGGGGVIFFVVALPT